MPWKRLETICTVCHKVFLSRKRPFPLFCSHACFGRTRRKPLEQAFLEKVHKGAGDDCWIWTGAQNSKHYGTMRLGSITQPAPRVSFLLAYGYMPVHHVAHTCDTPLCVNPKHLKDWTNRENKRDASRKGRNRNGAGPNSPMNEQIAAAIRALAGTMSQQAIADKFGIGQSSVSRILLNKSWTI